MPPPAASTTGAVPTPAAAAGRSSNGHCGGTSTLLRRRVCAEVAALLLDLTLLNALLLLRLAQKRVCLPTGGSPASALQDLPLRPATSAADAALAAFPCGGRPPQLAAALARLLVLPGVRLAVYDFGYTATLAVHVVQLIAVLAAPRTYFYGGVRSVLAVAAVLVVPLGNLAAALAAPTAALGVGSAAFMAGPEGHKGAVFYAVRGLTVQQLPSRVQARLAPVVWLLFLVASATLDRRLLGPGGPGCHSAWALLGLAFRAALLVAAVPYLGSLVWERYWQRLEAAEVRRGGSGTGRGGGDRVAATAVAAGDAGKGSSAGGGSLLRRRIFQRAASECGSASADGSRRVEAGSTPPAGLAAAGAASLTPANAAVPARYNAAAPAPAQQQAGPHPTAGAQAQRPEEEMVPVPSPALAPASPDQQPVCGTAPAPAAAASGSGTVYRSSRRVASLALKLFAPKPPTGGGGEGAKRRRRAGGGRSGSSGSETSSDCSPSQSSDHHHPSPTAFEPAARAVLTALEGTLQQTAAAGGAAAVAVGRRGPAAALTAVCVPGCVQLILQLTLPQQAVAEESLPGQRVGAGRRRGAILLPPARRRQLPTGVAWDPRAAEGLAEAEAAVAALLVEAEAGAAADPDEAAAAIGGGGGSMAGAADGGDGGSPGLVWPPALALLSSVIGGGSGPNLPAPPPAPPVPLLLLLRGTGEAAGWLGAGARLRVVLVGPAGRVAADVTCPEMKEGLAPEGFVCLRLLLPPTALYGQGPGTAVVHVLVEGGPQTPGEGTAPSPRAAPSSAPSGPGGTRLLASLPLLLLPSASAAPSSSAAHTAAAAPAAAAAEEVADLYGQALKAALVPAVVPQEEEEEEEEEEEAAADAATIADAEGPAVSVAAADVAAADVAAADVAAIADAAKQLLESLLAAEPSSTAPAPAEGASAQLLRLPPSASLEAACMAYDSCIHDFAYDMGAVLRAPYDAASGAGAPQAQLWSCGSAAGLRIGPPPDVVRGLVVPGLARYLQARGMRSCLALVPLAAGDAGGDEGLAGSGSSGGGSGSVPLGPETDEAARGMGAKRSVPNGSPFAGLTGSADGGGASRWPQPPPPPAASIARGGHGFSKHRQPPAVQSYEAFRRAHLRPMQVTGLAMRCVARLCTLACVLRAAWVDGWSSEPEGEVATAAVFAVLSLAMLATSVAGPRRWFVPTILACSALEGAALTAALLRAPLPLPPRLPFLPLPGEHGRTWVLRLAPPSPWISSMRRPLEVALHAIWLSAHAPLPPAQGALATLLRGAPLAALTAAAWGGGAAAAAGFTALFLGAGVAVTLALERHTRTAWAAAGGRGQQQGS